MDYIAPYPWVGPLATAENMIRCAQAAENMGYSEISIGEHFVYPRHRKSPHPYNPGGALPFRDDEINLDVMVGLTFAAAHTTSLKLRSGVIVLPYYAPFHVAKQAATLDYLSGGRLVLGIGAGWMEDEFDLLHLNFKERGSMTDEYIEIIRALWKNEDYPNGKYFRFADVNFPGRTVQKYPPIYIGGSTPSAMRRTARLGDGWMPIDIPSKQASERRAQLNRCLEEFGRSVSDVALTGVAVARFGQDSDPTADHAHAPDLDTLLRQIEDWTVAGAENCIVSTGSYYVSIDEWMRRLEWFAENVIRKAPLV